MSFDQKCYDLAALFASDLRPDPTEEEKAELAQIIQDAIEDWMSSKPVPLVSDDMHQPGSPTFDGAAAHEAHYSQITDEDRAYMHKLCDAITPSAAQLWLFERLKNCIRHASKHHGEDRRGWLEDAAFFAAAASNISLKHRQETEAGPAALKQRERT